MTYHINFFQNASKMDAVTANPAAQRDTYFIQAALAQKPNNNVEINSNGGSWTNYDAAFPGANWIYTGVYAYCFWDNTNSGIYGVTQQQPGVVQVLYDGSAGNLQLTVNSNGTITFTPN